MQDVWEVRTERGGRSVRKTGLAGSCTRTMAVGPGGGYRDGEVGKNELSEGFQTEPLKGLWWSWGRGELGYKNLGKE